MRQGHLSVAERPEGPPGLRLGPQWASGEVLDETTLAGLTHVRENVMAGSSLVLPPKEIVEAVGPWQWRARQAVAPPQELRVLTLARAARPEGEPLRDMDSLPRLKQEEQDAAHWYWAAALETV